MGTHLHGAFVHVFPACHSVSHAEQGSAWADYLSPWELDERRGGLIAASWRQRGGSRGKEREKGGQQIRNREKEDKKTISRHSLRIHLLKAEPGCNVWPYSLTELRLNSARSSATTWEMRCSIN